MEPSKFQSGRRLGVHRTEARSRQNHSSLIGMCWNLALTQTSAAMIGREVICQKWQIGRESARKA